LAASASRAEAVAAAETRADRAADAAAAAERRAASAERGRAADRRAVRARVLAAEAAAAEAEGTRARASAERDASVSARDAALVDLERSREAERRAADAALGLSAELVRAERERDSIRDALIRLGGSDGAVDGNPLSEEAARAHEAALRPLSGESLAALVALHDAAGPRLRAAQLRAAVEEAGEARSGSPATCGVCMSARRDTALGPCGERLVRVRWSPSWGDGDDSARPSPAPHAQPFLCPWPRPAGHVFCANCCSRVDQCPLCRRDVESRVRVYV